MACDNVEVGEIVKNTVPLPRLTGYHHFSSSTFRPFRHTATMIALNLISALSTVANRAFQEKKIANRQLGAERRKTSSGNATERLKMLEEKSKTLANKETRLNGYIKHYLDS